MIPGGYLRWLPVVATAVALVMAGLVGTRHLVACYRKRGVPAGLAARRAWATTVMSVWTLPWLVVVLTPLDAPRDVRLVPLRDLVEILADPPLTAFFQIVGNLLVFAAVGFGLGMGWQVRLTHVVIVAAGMSTAVEVLQYALALGRVSSIDDVLLNTAGAGLAVLAARRLPVPARLLPVPPPR
ncbi:VanZ family protein [Micromonospora fiedleri]|uniref:VanZ family protein n=2 Tax=Micromonospora TaxID=1873 RepID=A0ABS1UVG0_9ACTN|nr:MULTISPECIES: VanZ family protein [Micromonospora]MBL6280355.1 VanZ family protein [Micromonospora fiedleri]